MNIIFATFHPVDPQIVKFVSKGLIENGNKILFTVVEKEGIINDIIKSYGFNSVIIGGNKKSILGKLINVFRIDYNLIRVFISFKPDIIFSPTSPYTGHVSRLLGIPNICWADTETAMVNLKNSLPFLKSLLIPNSFYIPMPQKKVIEFNGYKEIAYLHPNVFKPDNSVLEQLGLKKSDKIVLMRFSALNAMHDIGLKSEAISNDNKIFEFIQKIEKKFKAKVFISVTERDLDDRFNKYKLQIEPSKYVHLLAFCSLYIGEGTTTASEAGVLGVPWIALRDKPLGYLIDQEKNYKLGCRIDDIDLAFKKAEEYLQNNHIKTEWQIKRKKLLDDKIDVSAFLIWFIKNYPKSHKIMKKNPDYQNRFR